MTAMFANNDRTSPASDTLDLAGIGIGPSNLSLASLLDGIGNVRAHFYESRASFDWHPGMMLPDVELQSSYLKDLVTPVMPTSPWSFISYLVAHKTALCLPQRPLRCSAATRICPVSRSG